MESLNKVISSFNPKHKLEPNIWSDNGKKINPKVRKNLLEIAHQFIDTFNNDVVIEDIIVVGSIANYNWSQYSDIDLHILVDYGQFSKRIKNLYVDFFDLKKIVFNKNRNIKMYGYDVEVYVEDSDIEGISDGVYSLMNDEWVKAPNKEKYKKPDTILIKRKSKQWMRIIDGVLKNIKKEDPKDILKILKKYKDKLKKYRLCGLEKGGESSIENLVFKVLRRNGYIEKLYNTPIELIDKKLSLNESTLSNPLEVMNVGSKFGIVRPGLDTKRPHPGVDLRASSGTNVYSPEDGIVIDSEIRNDSCGGTLYIDHKNGYKSRYCHLKQIDVKKGDEVNKGQKVGLSGGNAGDVGHGFSTGAHLHFELYYNGKLIDPMSALSGEFDGYEPTDKIEPELDITFENLDTIKEKIFTHNPKLEENDDPKIIDPIKENEDLKIIYDWINNNISFKENEKIILKDKNVEILQKGLQFLNYLDKNYGIDGYYDEKTINAVKLFKKDFDSYEDSSFTKDDIIIFYYLLIYSLYNDSNIVFEPNYTELKLTSMNNFYEMVLIGLDVDITYNNLNFLRAWNDVTTIGGEENPFGLIYLKDTEKEKPIEKTIKTLKSDEYFCLINNLRENKTIQNLLNCRFFDKDNLRTKIENYLKTE